jgi:hypothetical protein
MSEYTIWKDDRFIAKAGSARMASISWKEHQLYCVFFPTIKLHSTIVFEHLAGTALSRFLHNAVIKHNDKNLTATPMGYVHGRSEVARGKPKISSVLLVNAAEPLSLLSLTESSAHIYKTFLEVMGNAD